MITIVELGIVRNVAREDGTVVVTVTPTYSGCPATAMIAADIRRTLMEAGVQHCRIETQLSPAWTTDWIVAEAKGGREIWCYFNNDMYAHAIHDALTLKSMVGQALR